MKCLPKAVNKDMLVQELEKELLIYDLKKNKAYSLNETTAAVYKACDGQTDLEEFAAVSSFSSDLIFFTLDELKKKNLIADDKSVSPFSGMTRREVIKRVGAGTAATLPVILMLTAPISTQAASCTPEGSTCTTAAECCPNPNYTVLCFEFPANSGNICRAPIPS